MSDHTFLGLPAATLDSLRAGDAEVAFVGVPHGVPYPNPGLTAGCADAPAAVRERSRRLAPFVAHHDFDLDGPMIPPSRALRVVDVGDVPGSAADGPGNAARTEAAVRSLLDTGSVPLIFGGDDSIPIPVLRAFAGRGPICVFQVDAHLDYRDEVSGVREGYSSTMRRIGEMEHVSRVLQAGLRGVGSARTSDVADARAAGNVLITARQVRERGVPWLLGQLPAEMPVFLLFDLDALDPAVAPAVSGLSPGGLSYDEAADLVSGIAANHQLAGAAFTELVPALDATGASALVVVRLATLLLGTLARRP